LPAALVSTWLEAPLAGVLGGLSVRQVLERHDSDLWSEADRPGLARLRVPLPRGREDAGQGGAATPERPEFYDFDLLQWPEAAPELARRSLRGLSFAAFDTETTGLHPAVDDIVSIAAVRIVNGRILTGETFNRLVNPGRPIPPESTRIHRITDAMVADRPPLAVVLPQFKAFAADAVLVGHNIAFDLSFLQAKEAATGVKLDNPILDIMLLSAMLHAETDDHGLDALAVRYGVEIVDRHSALGDAMITAAVLAAMLDTLERRGVKTLDEAVKASRVVVELKARQARFAAAGA
jgi:DNA polymerase-3 subunit epsilon